MIDFLLSHFSVQDLIWLVVAFPLLGFVVNGAVSIISYSSGNEPRSFSIVFSELVTMASLIFIIVLWYILYGLEEAAPSIITGGLFDWKGFLNEPLEFGLKVDQFSIVIAFVLGFVGFLACLYSVGYLSKEKRVSLYFALFNLALALLFLMVLSESFFVFYVAWQLLAVLGFIFVNRFFVDSRSAFFSLIYYTLEMISGAAFLLVMFLIWKGFEDSAGLNLDIFKFASLQIGSGLLLPYANIICLSLLLSVLMRSLQFPLYVWMSDASNAPLPIFNILYAVGSVLISTYILIRLNFLMVLSPQVLAAMAVLGAIACFFAASAALLQRGAMKAVSYLVISQIGLAFIGIGVGAFSAAVFHVFIHTIYISCILLGIGSVIFITGSDSFDEIHGMRRYLPVTFWTILFGAISAVGIYPFSGFFAKNGILWEAYQRGHNLIFFIAFLACVVSAIALFRIIALLFFGKKPAITREDVRLEESSVSMLVVMVILAFASVVAGWFGVSPAFGGVDHFGKWLEPGMATQMVHMIGEKGRFSELVLAVIVTLFVAHAALITLIIYSQKRKWADRLRIRFSRTSLLLENGFYLNEFYKYVFIKPVAFFSNWVLWKGFDRLVVQGVIMGSIGRGINLAGEIIGKVRVVSLPDYLFWIIAGLVAVVGWSII